MVKDCEDVRSRFQMARAIGAVAAVAVAAEEDPLRAAGSARTVCRDFLRLASGIGVHDAARYEFVEKGVEIVVAWLVQLERQQPLAVFLADFAFDDAFTVFCEQGGVWL